MRKMNRDMLRLERRAMERAGVTVRKVRRYRGFTREEERELREAAQVIGHEIVAALKAFSGAV
jgi:hypothetical protein